MTSALAPARPPLPPSPETGSPPRSAPRWSAVPSDISVHRAVTAHVTDGLDGVLRVVTVLRGRRYRIRDLSVDVRDGVVESRVRCTLVLPAGELDLLLERLRRLPAVMSAENA
jgi:hypothetical protein